MKTRHYSWLICAGSTLLLFCTVGLATSAFSVYQPYMIQAGNLTNTQGSTILTVRSLAALFSLFFVDKFLRRTDIRLGALIALIGCTLSFVLFAVSHSFLGYCAAAAVAGVSYGLGGMIPVSMLIDRWFVSHRAFALGICAAGTGVATIIAPPLLTALMEVTSVATAFFAEAAFIAVAAVTVFLLLRNRPEEMGLSALASEEAAAKAAVPAREGGTNRSAMPYMLAAFVMIGAIANPGFSHLSVLYKTEGFDAMHVSFLISFVGAALTVGKCVYGRIADKLGSYKSGLVFFSLLVAGEGLSCFAGKTGFGVAMTAMFCLGLGLPLSTVGLSVFAKELSSSVEYAKTLKRLQMAYMIGSLLFGPVPGMIADATGSYVPAYVLLSVCAAASMVLVLLSHKQPMLRRLRRGMLFGHTA